MPRWTTTETERFWSKVYKSGYCWLWTASCTADGYGQFRLHGRNVYAHRYLYELTIGPLEPAVTLDHLCRARACVRPSHLEPVTNRVNVLRGDGITARQARQTHCKNGHPFDEANTYWWHGTRICRACRRQTAAAR